jgi:hypothetical protein
MRKVTLGLALLLLAGTTANAATIYATNVLTRPYNGPDMLIKFDSSNPSAYTVIGSTGINNYSFGGLDFDAEGNLWGYITDNKTTGGAASGLYRINKETGAATLQGTVGPQSLQDLAFNPVDNQMYGIRTQNNVSKLYRVNLTTGAVTSVGTFTGLPAENHVMSFAIDATGSYYVHDLNVDKIFKGAGLALTELYTLPQDTNFSQGMTIDWAHGDIGYHAAVGYGVYPHYFSQLNTFLTDGSAYELGPDFGPELPDNLPPVECGDLAIDPTAVPEPTGILLLLSIGALVRRR